MEYIYVAEMPAKNESEEKPINIKKEISQSELDSLNSCFSFCRIHHSITEIKNIVIGNGIQFKNWINPENIQKQKDTGMSIEDLVLTSNRFVLNYASSIATFIDIAKTLIEKYKPNEIDWHKNITHHFYDTTLEYRFWALFRNYVVHCSLPYTAFEEKIGSPCRVICKKSHLLEYKKWKHCQQDIESMSNNVQLENLVDNMSAIVLAIYLDFYALFSNEIMNGIKSYGEFCGKFSVERPVILHSHSETDFEGSHMQPLPVDKLNEAFNVLKSNPNIKMNVV